MTAREQEYLAYLRRHGETDQAELMRALNASQRASSFVLGRLLEQRAVSFRHGIPADRGGVWDGPADWLWRVHGSQPGLRRSRLNRSVMGRSY